MKIYDKRINIEQLRLQVTLVIFKRKVHNYGPLRPLKKLFYNLLRYKDPDSGFGQAIITTKKNLAIAEKSVWNNKTIISKKMTERAVVTAAMQKKEIYVIGDPNKGFLKELVLDSHAHNAVVDKSLGLNLIKKAFSEMTSPRHLEDFYNTGLLPSGTNISGDLSNFAAKEFPSKIIKMFQKNPRFPIGAIWPYLHHDVLVRGYSATGRVIINVLSTANSLPVFKDIAGNIRYFERQLISQKNIAKSNIPQYGMAPAREISARDAGNFNYKENLDAIGFYKNNRFVIDLLGYAFLIEGNGQTVGTLLHSFDHYNRSFFKSGDYVPQQLPTIYPELLADPALVRDLNLCPNFDIKTANVPSWVKRFYLTSNYIEKMRSYDSEALTFHSENEEKVISDELKHVTEEASRGKPYPSGIRYKSSFNPERPNEILLFDKVTNKIIIKEINSESTRIKQEQFAQKTLYEKNNKGGTGTSSGNENFE